MNKMTFDKTEYESEKEMWEDISSLIKILTRWICNEVLVR